MKKSLLMSMALIAFALLAAISANAAEESKPATPWNFNLGLGGTFATSEYKGVNQLGMALPILGYEGEWLYLRGLSGGVHLLKTEHNEINAQISYLPQKFYASWSDSTAMKKLDDRYSTAMAGINYRLRTDYGVLSATVSTDALGVSNGVVGDASYSYSIRFADLSIIPAVGAQWTDVNHNEYYYGVSRSESRDSGLSHYAPEGAVSPYGELTMRMGLTESWSAFVSGKATFLGQQITDSPMVDQGTKYSVSTGLLYAF